MAVDLRWKIPKSNQLWVKWSKIETAGNGIVKLKNAEFFGPVMQDCAKIEATGHIFLDLTKHFIVIIPSPYIIKLSWDKVTSQDNKKAFFDEIILEDTTLGHLNKLKDNDFILMDCTGHTTEHEAKGKYLASYHAMIYKDSMEPYDFI